MKAWHSECFDSWQELSSAHQNLCYSGHVAGER
jgi:hypothetical protein